MDGKAGYSRLADQSARLARESQCPAGDIGRFSAAQDQDIRDFLVRNCGTLGIIDVLAMSFREA